MVRKWGPTTVTTQDKDAPPRSCPGPLPTRSLSLLPGGSDHSVLPSHTLHHWQSSKNNTESVCDQVVTPSDCKRAGLGQRKEGMAGWQGPWGLEDSPRLGPGRSGGWGPRGRRSGGEPPPGSSNDSDNFAIGHMCHNDVPQIITFHPQEKPGNRCSHYPILWMKNQGSESLHNPSYLLTCKMFPLEQGQLYTQRA